MSLKELTITQKLLGFMVYKFSEIDTNMFKEVNDMSELFDVEETELFNYLYNTHKKGLRTLDNEIVEVFEEQFPINWIRRSINNVDTSANITDYLNDVKKVYADKLIEKATLTKDIKQKKDLLNKANDYMLVKNTSIESTEMSDMTKIFLNEMDNGQPFIKFKSWYQFSKRVLIEDTNFIIICGIPGTCKTSFALNMSLELAKVNKRGLFISLEMGVKELIRRTTSIISGISMNKLTVERYKELSDAEIHCVNKAFEFYNEHKNHLNLTYISGATVSKIREAVKDYKPDYLVVDYLQLLKGDGKYNNRENEIADISRNLKMIAMDFKIPVFALAQLNREITKRTDKRPKSSDLKDSSSLEADANIILGLYREAIFNPQSNDTTLEICVTKQRNGGLGIIEADFFGSNQRVVIRDNQSWNI